MIITILSISSPGEEYSQMKKIQTEYYSNFPNVNFYLVENSETQKEKIKLVGNMIYVRGTEHVLHEVASEKYSDRLVYQVKCILPNKYT